MPSIEPQIARSIKIRPKGSHVVILVFSLIISGCIGSALHFLSEDRYYHMVVALLIGSPFCYFVWKSWFASHENIDAPPSSPTSISLQEGNMVASISADHRSVSSPGFMETMEHIMSVVRNRRPLPAPDGMTDDSGKPIPQSSSEAVDKVDIINSEVEEIQNTLRERGSTVDDEGEQQQSVVDVKAEDFQ